MPSRSLSDLHPTLAKAFTNAQSQWHLKYPTKPQPIITCTYRPVEEQNKLYAQGRTAPGQRVTNAKGGQSPHNFKPSYAFDVGFDHHGNLDWTDQLFIDFAKLITDPLIQWGGTFKSIPDKPHFELKGWKDKV